MAWVSTHATQRPCSPSADARANPRSMHVTQRPCRPGAYAGANPRPMHATQRPCSPGIHAGTNPSTMHATHRPCSPRRDMHPCAEARDCTHALMTGAGVRGGCEELHVSTAPQRALGLRFDRANGRGRSGDGAAGAESATLPSPGGARGRARGWDGSSVPASRGRATLIARSSAAGRMGRRAGRGGLPF